MKYLLTMNMSSAKGFPVHQITVEHRAKDINEFFRTLQENEFIMCNLMYKHKVDDMETEWDDRGSIIINTSLVGKAQQFVDYHGGSDAP